jgi:hypothetical protein
MGIMGNLTLRTTNKRFNRATICFSRDASNDGGNLEKTVDGWVNFENEGLEI